MKTKVYEIKIKSIAPRGAAYFIEDYNGNSDYFPQSQIFDDGSKLYASEWILEQKSITYSKKYPKWYDSKTARVTDHIEVIKIVPKKIEFNPNDMPNESLIK